MKLLLTSAGFENPKLGMKFIDLTGKNSEEIKVIFVPTASRTTEELKYVDKSRKELVKIGVFDENDIRLMDLTGLNLTNIIVSPHYCEEEKSIIEAFKKKSKHKVIVLTDKEALLITDENVELIK